MIRCQILGQMLFNENWVRSRLLFLLLLPCTCCKITPPRHRGLKFSKKKVQIEIWVIWVKGKSNKGLSLFFAMFDELHIKNLAKTLAKVEQRTFFIFCHIKYGKNMAKIWQKFGKNLAKIWQKMKKTLFNLPSTHVSMKLRVHTRNPSIRHPFHH